MAGKAGKEAGKTLDGLKQMYQEAANLALANDAGKYMPIIQQLQQVLLKVIQGVTQQEIQAANSMGQGGAGGMPGPQMMGGPSQASPPQGPPPAQGSPGIAQPNPDELRRVMAMQGAGG